MGENFYTHQCTRYNFLTHNMMCINKNECAQISYDENDKMRFDLIYKAHTSNDLYMVGVS